MPSVAPLVGTTHVHDLTFRMLHLCLERSYERVFGIDDDVIRLPFQLQPDSKSHRRTFSALSPFPTSTCMNRSHFHTIPKPGVTLTASNICATPSVLNA
jgi:hypothetical protein